MSTLYPASPWKPREWGSLPGLKGNQAEHWQSDVFLSEFGFWILFWNRALLTFVSLCNRLKEKETLKNPGDLLNKFWAVKLLQATCQARSSCKISVTENSLRSLYNLVSFECQIIQWSTWAYFRRRGLVKLACFCWDTAWRDACFQLPLPQVCGRVDGAAGGERALVPSGTEQFPSPSPPCL